MEISFLWIIALVALTMATMMISNKLKIAYPIALVVVGLLVCIIPGTPQLELNPELIFYIFLPPLLYESGWAVSWKELWKWRRIVGSFAFLVVFFSAMVVALVANTILPGFSLALGFLLGGVVSSPDAVSTAAILKFVKVPRRLASVLEGESLLNDASSLIIFRFAAIAVTTGQFIFYQAAGQFVWMLLGGLLIGVAFGWIALKLHKSLPTDSNTDVIMTLITPYLMYIIAELVGASGVIATVCGALYTSHRRHIIFSPQTRTRATHVWESVVFILNGVTFILVGLDLPEILAGIRAEGISVTEATMYGVIISVALVIARFVSVYSAIVVTQIMKHFITVADERIPSWKGPIIFGWAGMRGAVSLAAALSIPLMAGSEAFPQRNLIIYITFVVIFLTLVVQGLTLPILIRLLKLEDEDDDHLPEEEAEEILRRALSQNALDFLREKYPEDLKQMPALQHFSAQWEQILSSDDPCISERGLAIYLELLESQRALLNLLNKEPQYPEEVIRKLYHQIDLEETKWV